MAKSLGREFATMSDDERRKFALEEEEGSRELPAELAFDNPRDEEHMGRHYGTPGGDEVADAEHRDGMSAELDEDQHAQGVREPAPGKERGGSNKSGADDR